MQLEKHITTTCNVAKANIVLKQSGFSEKFYSTNVNSLLLILL